MSDHLPPGIYAMQRSSLDSIVSSQATGSQPSLSTHTADSILTAAGAEPRSTGRGYSVVGRTAVIPIVGLIAKGFDNPFFQTTDPTEVSQAVAAVANDPNVDRVVFPVDSPGGYSMGVGELADDIHSLRGKKKTTSYVSSLAASAGYWLAAQADEVIASPYSDLGSIGVYSVLYDTSKAYEAQGVSVRVVSTGGVKGSHVDGVEVTDETVAEVKRGISVVNEDFVAAVARGRGMDIDAVRKLNTGQTWNAREAQRLGLVDATGRLSDVLQSKVSASGARVVDGDMPPAQVTVPSNPPGNTGEGSDEDEWSRPTLSDFTDQSWEDLSSEEKNRIARHFAWSRTGLPPETYGDLALPHHRPGSGAISLRGVRNALARLPQTDGIPDEERSRIEAHLRAHLPDEDGDDGMDSSAEANHQSLNTAESLAMTRSHMADSPPDTQDAAPKSIEAGAENDLAAMRAEFATLKAEFAAEKQAKAAAEQKRVEALQATLKEEFNVSDERLAKFETSAALEALLEEKREDARVEEAGGRGTERGAKADAEEETDIFHVSEQYRSTGGNPRVIRAQKGVA